MRFYTERAETHTQVYTAQKLLHSNVIASYKKYQHGQAVASSMCKLMQSKLKACVVIKEHLNILPTIMNYKPLHLTYFMQ
jgi:hypothetical protein